MGYSCEIPPRQSLMITISVWQQRHGSAALRAAAHDTFPFARAGKTVPRFRIAVHCPLILLGTPLDKTDVHTVISVWTEKTEMTKLTVVQQKFILHWGKMGTAWGINRTVAQIHALLFLSPKPLHAEEIAETLGVARSNVSTSLGELHNWGIVKTVPVLGDRRDHFEAIADVWELFRVVLDERKRREVDPTLALLRECVAEAEKSKADEATRKKLSELLGFFETMSGWYDQLRRLPTTAVIKFVKLGDKVFKAVGIGG